MAAEAIGTRNPVSHELQRHNVTWIYTLYPILSSGNSATHFLLTVQDSDRKKSPEPHVCNTLATAKELYDAIPASILVVDANMRLVGWNRFSRDTINGRSDEEMHGVNPFNRVHPDDLFELKNRLFFNVMNFDTEETAEFRMYHKDGPPYRWATLRAKKAIIEGQPCVVVVVTEITELKEAQEQQEKLQEQLLQYQKMELIGQLAGGIAHDFNNSLAAIIGNTELVLRKLDHSCSYIDNIRDIHKIAVRSSQLTHQLLAFARKQMTIPKVIDLNEIISESLPLYSRLISENIQFEWTPCKNRAFVLIDPTQLEQILSNLFINARDAITGNGKIFIDCAAAHFENADCINNRSALSAGNYIRLSISDTGSGIEPKVLPHIYEPFFTTKEVGKGTGLGLSTVYGIVMQNNGHIECRTEMGKGSTFDIYLPQHVDSLNEKGSGATDQTILNSEKTILVVEDEPYILKLIKDILESRQFTVFTAKDAEECLLVSEKCKSRIDMLVTDVVLPTMNGVELSRLLQRDNPSLRALFMSAHAVDNITVNQPLVEGVDFIPKPFSIKEFIEAVNRVMSAP
ncbi:MAG: response regulator [Chlorobiaceae bacterium]|nr:response regulator [Chlorobiaceae bacterium]